MNLIYLIIFILISLPFLTNVTISIYTFFYQHLIYRKFIRPKFDRQFKPQCTVIIPVKNTSSTQEIGLTSFLTQNYPNYQLIFTIESANDPAITVINKLIQKFPHSQLVIAGLSQSCCQKNHNLIQAVRGIKPNGILVFADADIIVTNNWLSEMVAPLSRPNIKATTTYFWPSSKTGSLGEQTHNFMNIFTYTLFCFASNVLKSSLLWGGSIAIREEDFQKFNVIKSWSNQAVDDTSMSSILKKNQSQTCFIPSNLCQAQSSIQKYSQTVNWYVRQISYLKFYRRELWLYLIFSTFLIYTFIYFWLPFTYLVDQPYYYFIYIPFIYIFGEMYIAYLYLQLGPIKNPFKFVLLAPIYKFAQYVSFAKTLFARQIIWSGTTYQLDRHGKVSNIKR
jgi:ceramide glucosyltransferase